MVWDKYATYHRPDCRYFIGNLLSTGILGNTCINKEVTHFKIVFGVKKLFYFEQRLVRYFRKWICGEIDCLAFPVTIMHFVIP